jgi:hypothetical protein
MRFLVDGSNLLGRLGADRESAGAKRALARQLARLTTGGHSVVLHFDGERPAEIGAVGGVTMRFGGDRTADERIVDEARKVPGALTLVTSDQQLIARCRRRDLTVLSPAELLALLPEEREGEAPQSDWEQYFSDDKNRIDF